MRSKLLNAPIAWIMATGLLALWITGCGDDDSAPAEIISHSAAIVSDNVLIAEVTITLDREGQVYVEYENAQVGKFRTKTTDECDDRTSGACPPLATNCDVLLHRCIN